LEPGTSPDRREYYGRRSDGGGPRTLRGAGALYQTSLEQA